jgi:hypothetical protein
MVRSDLGSMCNNGPASAIRSNSHAFGAARVLGGVDGKAPYPYLHHRVPLAP